MGEHIQQQGLRRARIARKRSGQQTPEAIGRRLLEIVVYDKCCRVGGKLTLDDLVETSEVGDWKMPGIRKGGLFLRGLTGLADHPGRDADADHGGVGGGLTATRPRNGTFERIRPTSAS